MKVGELLLVLGLDVDDKQWNAGEAAIKQLTLELRKLEVEAKLATGDVNKAMSTIGFSSPSKAAKRTLGDLVKEGGRIESTFRRMAAAALGFFAVSGVKDMVMGTIELGGKLNDTAQKAGISTDALQELGYAAGLNSGTLDDVAAGTLGLSKNLEKLAQKGEGPAADAFKKLGISLQDPAIKSRNLEKIMYLVSSRFSQMEDGAYKTQIAMAIFGKTGANLIPTLNQGVQGLADMRREAREMGVVMDKEAVSSLDDLGDDVDKAKAALTGLKNQAVIALVPHIKRAVAAFREWVRENKELIKSTISRAISILISVLKTLGAVVAFVAKHWRVLAALFAALTVVNGIMAIIKAVIWFQAVQTKAAIQAVINWAMILGPILAIAAAVVALGLLVYKFRDQVWGALKAVGRFFEDVWEKIKSVGRAIGGLFVDVWGGMKAAFVAVWDFIYGKVQWVIDKIKWALDALSLSDFRESLDTKNEVASQELAEAGQDPKKLDEWRKKYGMSEDSGNPGESMIKLPDGKVVPLSEWRKMQGATGAVPGGASAPPPTRDKPGSGNGVNNTSSVQINIDAKNADAKEVASLVDLKLREHDERTRRQTAASLGIA